MTEQTETWAIIQARLGSTRFPGKVLKPLAGIPSLVHVVERARAIEGVTRVIVATSVEMLDDAVADLVMSRFDDVELVRGPEDDVLRRFALAVGDEPPPLFVRITGDSPMLCFEHTSAMRRAMLEAGADGADSHQHETGLTTGLGAEVYRTSTLLEADRFATPGPDREHVSTWIKRNPEYNILYPRPVEALVSDYRLTLDYPQDYDVLTHVYDALYEPGSLISSADAIAFLRDNESVAKINANCVHNVVH